jgi:hypothetical protein
MEDLVGRTIGRKVHRSSFDTGAEILPLSALFVSKQISASVTGNDFLLKRS